MENYLLTVGWAFEPKLSTLRLEHTKANSLVTAIDDVYDVYGSLGELELFTEAVDRSIFAILLLSFNYYKKLRHICMNICEITLISFEFELLCALDP